MGAGPGVEEAIGLYGSYWEEVVDARAEWFAGGGYCTVELGGLRGSWDGAVGFGGEAIIPYELA